MNYRHAFHAGNAADCFKHAMLATTLALLGRKPTPMLVLDTHAGPGPVALDGPDATRTGEARDGIGRLLAGKPLPAALAPFIAALDRAGWDGRRYPGSPMLALAMLRPADRLIACELQPEDHATLRRALAPERGRASVHRRDGFDAIRALLPPPAPHRRGLVLIDPPFEAGDDWTRLADAVTLSRQRFPGGTVIGWYPLKGRAGATALRARLRAAAVRDVVGFELHLRSPDRSTHLDGSGLVVAQPPWGLETDARAIGDALRARLGDGDDAAFVADRITDE